MKKITIKILQDTPFDKAYTILSLETFRRKYNLVNEHNSDEFLVNYVKDGYRSDYHDVDLSKWFEVIEQEYNNFKVGDWVWHEGEKKAFCVVTCISTLQKEWRPNYCSFEAANSCTETYKRKADKDEIDYYDLESFCDGRILIGEYKCYYYNNVWKDLIGIHKNITTYLSVLKNLTTVSTLKQFSSDIEGNWQCALNGLKVGCFKVEHDEVLKIGKKLKLI
jgi:hypothetical protein